jgi:ribose 5-phosphate isomerase A
MAIDIQSLKQQAAEAAADLVQPGMVVGLGHGSTAILAVRRLAELLRAGSLREITGVACSAHVEAEARRLGIRIANLDDYPEVDLTIDGADEVDPRLDLIKGGGGALLREKIVAQASRREVIIVDETKLSERLGTRFALPVEVVRFGWRAQAGYLESLGAQVSLRQAAANEPFLTDQGNLILDCRFGPIADAPALAERLQGRAGIVEHGLFIGLATDVLVAGQAGVRHLTRP